MSDTDVRVGVGTRVVVALLCGLSALVVAGVTGTLVSLIHDVRDHPAIPYFLYGSALVGVVLGAWFPNRVKGFVILVLHFASL